MAKSGSRILGSRSNAPVPAPDTDTESAPASVPPIDQPVRRTLNAMSPFRIGFLGTIGVLVAYGLARALIQAQSIVILIVVALFIALGLNPMVGGLVRRGVKRGLAILLVLVVVLAVLALALFAIIPVFAEQIGLLIAAAPDILQDTLRNPQVNSLNERFQLISRAQEFISSGTLVQRAFGGLLGAAGAVLGAVSRA